MTNSTKTVLVAGATGMLGSQIAHSVLNEGGSVRLLLREAKPSDAKKAELIAALAERGAEIVLGDLADAASLQRATRGAVTVVSALQGGPDVIIDGQVALAKAAADNGVRRFVPSDFSVDLFKLPDGSHPNLDIRRAADQAIAELPIEQTNVLNGGFMEITFAPFFQLIDLDKATVGYFGDAKTAFDVTTTADTARFTALAALENAAISGPFGVVGDVLTIEQLAAILSEIHNKPFTLQRKGSIADLEAWIKSEQTAGRGMAWPTLGAQYAWAMMSGRARIESPVNARYPSVITTKAREFLQR
jgi:uncharacterized protein YbjT (DUF2867 family)